MYYGLDTCGQHGNAPHRPLFRKGLLSSCRVCILHTASSCQLLQGLPQSQGPQAQITPHFGQPTSNEWSRKKFEGLLILTQLRRALEGYSSFRAHAWLAEALSQFPQIDFFFFPILNKHLASQTLYQCLLPRRQEIFIHKSQ